MRQSTTVITWGQLLLGPAPTTPTTPMNSLSPGLNAAVLTSHYMPRCTYPPQPRSHAWCESLAPTLTYPGNIKLYWSQTLHIKIPKMAYNQDNVNGPVQDAALRRKGLKIDIHAELLTNKMYQIQASLALIIGSWDKWHFCYVGCVCLPTNNHPQLSPNLIIRLVDVAHANIFLQVWAESSRCHLPDLCIMSTCPNMHWQN